MENHKKDHEKERGLSKSFYMKVIVLLASALILFALYNIFQISSFSAIFEQKLSEAKEAARPAEMQLITIKDAGCEDCFDILPIINSVKKANVNITKELNLEFDSDNAKQIIDQYDIKKIPTILLTGEIDKTKIGDLEERNGALIFTKLSPPYIDAESNKVVGRVSSVIIKDSSCDKCVDLDLLLEQIKKIGVTIVSERILEKGSEKGKELISKYSIERLPTLILSKDLGAYGSDIIRAMNQIGSVEEDGSYITREISPPYFDLSKNRVIGLVSMTVLADDGCDECYNASKFHEPILQGLGVILEDKKSIDVLSPEGKALIETYKIEKVPTMILKGDMGEYPRLVSAWKGVGTVESDGAYVFRKVEIAQQKYKDLSTNKIISPQTIQTTS